MVKIYYDLIIKPGSTFTIDMVPERWREAVRQMLIDNGYKDLAKGGSEPEQIAQDDGAIAHRQ